METEVKIRVHDAPSARNLLERHGFAVSVERLFESNTVYDTVGGDLRCRGELLRIRGIGPSCSATGSAGVLTFKGAAVPGKHKSRQELETTVADRLVLEAVLLRLGMTPMFRYEKYRTEYLRAEGGGIVTIDETPIGTFLEIEGAPDWIDATAAELGFSESDYLLASYGALYRDYCQARGREPSHMVFPSA